MLESKLSGSALILLLFNRLRKERKTKVLIAATQNYEKKLLLLVLFFLVFGSQLNMKFIAFSPMKQDEPKLINSPRWNFNF